MEALVEDVCEDDLEDDVSCCFWIVAEKFHERIFFEHSDSVCDKMKRIIRKFWKKFIISNFTDISAANFGAVHKKSHVLKHENYFLYRETWQ